MPEEINASKGSLSDSDSASNSTIRDLEDFIDSSFFNVNGDVAPNFAQVSGTSTPFQQQDDDTIYLSIYLSSNTAKPLRMRIISWGQQNIHVANPKKKLIIINYLKLR